MRLSRQALDSFKAKYLEYYSISLTDEEAEEKAMQLLQFIKVIYRPIPKENEYGKT